VALLVWLLAGGDAAAIRVSGSLQTDAAEPAVHQEVANRTTAGFGAVAPAAEKMWTKTVWRCSTEGREWEARPLTPPAPTAAVRHATKSVGLDPTVGASPPPPPAGTSALRIAVNTSRNGHTMEGFGGCFNEKGWEALAVLSEAGRAEVLTAMFGREGLRWGINRMPVGSSDFADSYYR
jgi:hypothetical protein